jgi:molecular chaperone GrpE
MAEERDEIEPAQAAEEKSTPAEGATEPEEQVSEQSPTHEEGEPEAGPIAVLEAEIERLKELHNKAVLAAAEYDNAAKRAQRELQDARKFASAGLARDLLPVVDNLRRALSTVPAEAVESDEQLKSLVTGVEMIERELLTVFERHNIEVMDPQDSAFDPHLHEAMFEAPDPERPDGTIVQVLQPGYRLHDRLLRPARVAVAKGGKPAADTGEAPAETPRPGDHVDTKA